MKKETKIFYFMTANGEEIQIISDNYKTAETIAARHGALYYEGWTLTGIQHEKKK